MGKNITLVGGNGDGQTTKVANQIIVALNIQAVAEALLFASKAGADPAKVRQALMGGFAASRILEVHGERMIKRTFDPGFRIELHQKDLNLALQGAKALGVSLPNTPRAGAVQRLRRQRLRQAGPLGAVPRDRNHVEPRDRQGREVSPPAAALPDGGRRVDCVLLRSVPFRTRMFATDANAALLSPQRQAGTPDYRDASSPRAAARSVRYGRRGREREHCLPPHLPQPPKGRTVVIGAGKAAAAMAQAVEAHWKGELSGLVVTRYGHGADCQRIEVVEAAHPVPDAAGQQAAQRMVELVQGLTADDLVLCLISGGGSALLAAPRRASRWPTSRPSTRRCSQRRQHRRDELRAQAPVGAQGRPPGLACAPARVETLLISDIPGDDPTLIASGPTLPDATTCADALAVIAKYGIDVPANVRASGERRGRNAEARRRPFRRSSQRDAGQRPAVAGSGRRAHANSA
jgi:hypothetical protein